MGIMTEAAEDVQDFIEKEGESCIFTVTDGETVITKTIKAIPAAYQRLYGLEFGEPIASKTARLSLSERSLTDVSYPVRNSVNRVALKGHRITYTDISGAQATYIVTDQFPNSVTGLIVLQLGEYAVHTTPPGKTIIGWSYATIDIQIRETPDGTIQTLPNGDELPMQYALNEDGTLTVTEIAGYAVLTPFMLSQFPIQDMPYDQTTGTFDNSANNGFVYGSDAQVNVVYPIYAA